MDNTSARIKGLSLGKMNYIMISASCVLYLLVIIAMLHLSSRYDELVETTETYINCRNLEAEFREDSDYLTEQVRLFSYNMKLEYINNYFEAAEESHYRTKALEELKRYQKSDDAMRFLETAIENSRQLTAKEIYAMRLVCDANNFREEYVNSEVLAVELTPADKKLSKDKKIEKARRSMFDTGYQNTKSFIVDDVSIFLENISEKIHMEQETSIDELREIISKQRLYISILFGISLADFAMIIILVIRPLKIYIDRIKSDKKLDVSGAYEFRYLAKTYNSIYEQNEANEALLRHKAEHDALTGIMNRGSYEQVKELMKNSETPVALLQIDVDKFKGINDGYGHETGDKVLIKVAKLLEETFRSTDYPCRIGGDEFAVIMPGITPKYRDIIISKLEAIREKLTDTSDGLPRVTLSIGIAFSDKGFPDDLTRSADKVLYDVKNSGRDGYKFCEEYCKT